MLYKKLISKTSSKVIKNIHIYPFIMLIKPYKIKICIEKENNRFRSTVYYYDKNNKEYDMFISNGIMSKILIEHNRLILTSYSKFIPVKQQKEIPTIRHNINHKNNTNQKINKNEHIFINKLPNIYCSEVNNVDIIVQDNVIKLEKIQAEINIKSSVRYFRLYIKNNCNLIICNKHNQLTKIVKLNKVINYLTVNDILLKQ